MDERSGPDLPLFSHLLGIAIVFIIQSLLPITLQTFRGTLLHLLFSSLVQLVH